MLHNIPKTEYCVQCHSGTIRSFIECKNFNFQLVFFFDNISFDFF
jgi:hypothetical protein